jgi:ATP-dependent RNA helicase RhlE
LTTFAELALRAPVLETLAAQHYVSPTPIQAQAIPHILSGRDLLGIAQTGTGKTAAFALPILQLLAGDGRRAPRRGCRALVLAPTRELASQINESFRVYGRGHNLSSTVIFGGVAAGPQIRALAAGVDIVVATPGRLIDHLDQGNVRLQNLEILVLDEVDRMLDMGFIQPVRRIVRASPSERQTLLFSATMPSDVRQLAAEFLDEPIEVAVTPVASTVKRVEQRVIHVESHNKAALLSEMLGDQAIGRALVFTRTKRGADRVARHLAAAGVNAASIHGNKSQGQREQALAAFRSGRTRVLVATDIAARGIDVDGITHVFNFELPNIPESYVHRIGRTARAGAAGMAISFCDADERAHLRGIETLIRQKLPADDHRGHPARSAARIADPVRTPKMAVMKAKPVRLGENRPKRRPDAQKRSAAAAPAGSAEPRHDLSNVRFLATSESKPRSPGAPPRHPAQRKGARVVF